MTFTWDQQPFALPPSLMARLSTMKEATSMSMIDAKNPRAMCYKERVTIP